MQVEKHRNGNAKKGSGGHKSCHDETHPDHANELPRLRRTKGQLEGIEKMILDRRYCPDIIMQVRAARSALQSLEASILKTHLKNCVRDALSTKDAFSADEKIQEIIEILTK